ncbi:nucleotidyl transferase AbiEii/AbiGii toxin family protein [Candidatus Micrarchaeota archaeon]|nr:nucleotidyl transferase AbiEii/AbiGii toxin family protein [Candidatus Micrarchaeota archaeon]
MMDKKEIVQICKRKGLLNKEFIEKDYYIDHVLYEIFSRTNNVVFKGGTALYKIYGFPRFSEDIDLSMINDVDVNSIIAQVSEKLGFRYSIKKFGTSVMVKFTFNGFLTDTNRIRVDFSKYHKPISYSLVEYVSDYIDVKPFLLYVMDKKEILSEKVHAIYHRNKARDMYDLFYLLRTEEFDVNLIKRKVPEFDTKIFISKLKKYKDVWDSEIKIFAMEYISYNLAHKYITKKLENIKS